MPKKLFWRIYLSLLPIVLLSLAAVAWYTLDSLKHFYLGQLGDSLEARARLFSEMSDIPFDPEHSEAIVSLCEHAGNAIGTRLTVILPSGLVLGDSDKNPDQMDNHADRPEIIEALQGHRSVYTRFSHTLQKEMMYVAIPVKRGDAIKAVVRASMPLPVITKTLQRVYRQIILAGLAVAFFATGLSFFVVRWINIPLQKMKDGAERFAEGDLSYRLHLPDLEETGALADAMNHMAEQLDERIQTITRQRNELETVLSSMEEAVLVLKPDLRVVRLNRAAGRLFGVVPGKIEGLPLSDITTNEDLHCFLEEQIEKKNPHEGDISLQGEEDHFLQAHGRFVLDTAGKSSLLLVVLNDITRLKKLENVRRDFVANVSHELKTPITSIKGFVETLRDGAYKDEKNAEYFLDIIARHSERLNAIIDDLLVLSRIEQDNKNATVMLQKGPVKTVMDSAALLCTQKAAEKSISIELEDEENVTALMDMPLFEQALMNLIDNAINYSGEGSTVRVKTKAFDDEIRVSVSDSGVGIPKEHIPRLFERFYRVDQARSRKLGGTGLGLAIVKHIVSAHRGRIVVESIPGEGSTFSIYLPRMT